MLRMQGLSCRSGAATLQRALAVIVAVALLAVWAAGCVGPSTQSGSAQKGSSANSAGAGVAGGKMRVLSGLCFSPFLDRSPSSPVPLTDAQVSPLLDDIVPYTRGIRTFSSMGIGANIAALAKAKGLTVAAGCDISSDPARNEQEVSAIIALARSGKVDIAVVGEEALYTSSVSEAQLIDYINRVRATGVRTTTSDTWGELIGHPNVIAACDLVLANMYPYWEDQGIYNSVRYLNGCYDKVKKAAGSLKDVEVETGWPSDGNPKGPADPSQANANWFLRNFTSWAQKRGVKYFYFEAFDEPWKAASLEGSVGSHWGLFDDQAQLKPGVAQALSAPPTPGAF